MTDIKQDHPLVSVDAKGVAKIIFTLAHPQDEERVTQEAISCVQNGVRQLGFRCMTSLPSAILSFLDTLTHLDLGDCPRVGEAIIRYLVPALHDNRSLRHLDLSRSTWSFEQADQLVWAVARLLVRNQCLRTVHLTGVPFGTQYYKILTDVVKFNPRIISLGQLHARDHVAGTAPALYRALNDNRAKLYDEAVHFHRDLPRLLKGRPLTILQLIGRFLNWTILTMTRRPPPKIQRAASVPLPTPPIRLSLAQKRSEKGQSNAQAWLESNLAHLEASRKLRRSQSEQRDTDMATALHLSERKQELGDLAKQKKQTQEDADMALALELERKMRMEKRWSQHVRWSQAPIPKWEWPPAPKEQKTIDSSTAAAVDEKGGVAHAPPAASANPDTWLQFMEQSPQSTTEPSLNFEDELQIALIESQRSS